MAERFGIALGKFSVLQRMFDGGNKQARAIRCISDSGLDLRCYQLERRRRRYTNSVPALPSLAVSIRVKTQESERVETVPFKAVRVRLS